MLAVDPQAARRRREDTEKSARVDCWPEPCGTASLAGWHLPSAQALAADKRLCQIAAAWRKQGAAGETDLLRARAYLALLLGLPIDAPPADLLPPADPPVPGDPAPTPHPATPPPVPACGADARLRGPPGCGPALARARASQCGRAGLPDGLRRPSPGALPPVAGLVNLTVPLTTLLGLTEAPGQAAGYGPLDADTARVLACAAAGHRATRWQITVTAPDGTALAHGTAARCAGSTAPGQAAPGQAAPAQAAGGRSPSPPSRWPPDPATTGTANPATGPAPPCSG